MQPAGSVHARFDMATDRPARVAAIRVLDGALVEDLEAGTAPGSVDS